jgi:hypothetical protein
VRIKVLSERPPSSKGELKIADPSAYKILNLENKTYFVAPIIQMSIGTDVVGFSVDQDPIQASV